MLDLLIAGLRINNVFSTGVCAVLKLEKSKVKVSNRSKYFIRHPDIFEIYFFTKAKHELKIRLWKMYAIVRLLARLSVFVHSIIIVTKKNGRNSEVPSSNQMLWATVE